MMQEDVSEQTWTFVATLSYVPMNPEQSGSISVIYVKIICLSINVYQKYTLTVIGLLLWIKTNLPHLAE